MPAKTKATKAPPRRPNAWRQFKSAAYAHPGGAPGDLKGLYAAMRRYIEHRAVLGSTDVGLWSMEYKLREFIAWANERGVTHPSQVSRPVLERYQRWLYHRRKKDGNALSVASQRTKLVPLKGFFKWLTRAGELLANPASDLELPRMIRRLPRSVLSPSEVERVLALADTSTPFGLRDRAMLEVLYATGMRRMELARLTTGDIDPERCLVQIRLGKGGKDRIVPLGERALHWIGRYLEGARPQLAWNGDDHTLFLNREGRALELHWLTEHVRRYINRAELGKTGSCHLLRHTMATLMLEGGADIRFIQAMLGHAELSTTQIYTHVAIVQLQKVHAMSHPGVHRRVRGETQSLPAEAATLADVPTPEREPIEASEALLDALDAETDDDGADTDTDTDTAADAWRRR